MRLVAPSARSTCPRTTSAGDVRATRRNRRHSPAVHTTLSSPVSSSTDRKVTPPAVPGRCRWVTTPATATRRPASCANACATRSTPAASSPSRTYCVG